jgi:peroxiredoxin
LSILKEELEMSLTPSTMLALGSPAPDFDLPEVETGARIGLKYFSDRQALLVMFICRHCPYVKHIQEELARIGADYAGSDLGIVAISSNDAEKYPDDRPESLRAMKAELGFEFPVCHDESQQTAKAYSAACTPDFFLFDAERQLVYRGRLDASRPGNSEPVNGRDLRTAIENCINQRPVSPRQEPSMGCNIKWKPGNEPEYFK